MPWFVTKNRVPISAGFEDMISAEKDRQELLRVIRSIFGQEAADPRLYDVHLFSVEEARRLRLSAAKKEVRA